MEGNYLDFTKIRCKEHPLDLITNYCLNNSCMIGLCSQCVCSHTQMHMKTGTAPILKPLKDIHSNFHTQTNKLIKLLESDKDRIMNIMKNMTERRKNYKFMIQEVKKDVIKVIDKIFDQFQIKFQEQVKNQQKKTGLHSSFQIQSMCRKINRQINTLVNEAQMLNTTKFLDLIKTIQFSTFDQVQKVRRQISKQIKDNQQFVSNLNYNKEYISDIECAAKKLITHSFFYPKMITTLTKQPLFAQTSQRFYSDKQNVNILKVRSDGFKAFAQLPNQSIIKQEKSHKNVLHRSNSQCGINYVHQVPQYIDSCNFYYQPQNRLNGNSQLKLMTASRIFNHNNNRR